MHEFCGLVWLTIAVPIPGVLASCRVAGSVPGVGGPQLTGTSEMIRTASRVSLLPLLLPHYFGKRVLLHLITNILLISGGIWGLKGKTKTKLLGAYEGSMRIGARTG